MDSIRLHILSPEGTLLDAQVELVTLPGGKAPFTVLKDHAPIVSSLSEGEIRYVSEGKEERIGIREGFVRVGDNTVTACVEV